MLKTGPGSVSLDYDPLGRLYQTSGGSTTRFQYDGTDMIAEYDGSNNMLRRYVHGPGTDEPILEYEGSGLSNKNYLTADERGSIVAVTNGSGTLTATNRYDEYGNPASTNAAVSAGGRFGYTGQMWLPELGVWYYKARVYNPYLGRFMQTDPIGYSDGMNWYNYVGSNPINRVDPTGLLAAGCQIRTGSRIPDCSARNTARSYVASHITNDTEAAGGAIIDTVANYLLGNVSLATVSFVVDRECATLISPCGRYWPIDFAMGHIRDVHFGAYDTGWMKSRSIFSPEFQSRDAIEILYKYAAKSSIPVPYGRVLGSYSITVFFPLNIVGKDRDGFFTHYITFTVYRSGFDSDGLPLYIPSDGYPGKPSK